MATIIEVKYFNSFLLKKTMPSDQDVAPVWNGSTGVPVTNPTSGGYPVAQSTDQNYSWFVEESRIRGGYNNTNTDYGVRAYIVDNEADGSIRGNALIYSGIFNSRTGINNTNVFNVAEDITKAVDPANGSIQKLYAEDTNLIIFQENKVNKALIDKDAIYSAEGQGSAVSTANLVIGQIVPYAGNFGISTNPESFAVYGYRKYFIDKNRNAILRLSQDGITEISNYGMYDYFRDELSSLSVSDKAIGAWDIHTKQYVVSLQGSNITATTSGPDNLISDTYQTLSFDESVLGWTSRYTYKPDQAFSVKSKYYTTIDGKLYEHNFQPFLQDDNRGNFYSVYSDSTVTFIFNPKVSASKVFKTVNYEGSTGWEVSQFNAARSFELNDTSNLVYSYDEGAYTEGGIQYYAGFYKKEGKYFANLVNNNNLGSPGEVVYGQSISGVKGYYATVTIRTDNSTRVPGLGGKTRELFAVSSEYVESSY
ncbi:MAG: hypothetical protein ACXACE_16460 [Candidatus Thorarchaeota archaeon]|jgi:hypothetical protein